MKMKLYFVVRVHNNGYYITDKPRRGEQRVCFGSWDTCRKFISPNY
jgi:hypothetical protein